MLKTNKTPKKQGKKPVSIGYNFIYEGRQHASGKVVKGEISAENEKEAQQKLLRQGISSTKLTKEKRQRSKSITQSDVTVFARQLATMMKAGLPLLQAFDIVAKGHSNPSMTKLLMTIRTDIEQGESLSSAFAAHPKYFDKLFCNLVAAGEAGGVLEGILDKLATYKEKTESIKKKVKGALMYPAIVLIVAFGLIIAMMMFVLPAFKEMYDGMGAEMPFLTQVVMDMSDFFVAYGVVIILGLVGGIVGLVQWHKHSPAFQKRLDGWLLRVPVFGPIVQKASIARWGRTAAALFAAGVPLVEALNSVGGASGNILYEEATDKIQAQVRQGESLNSCMKASGLFPNMFLQMAAIGEESGSLDAMLDKASSFYEEEVDNAVDSLSTLMEPLIMLILGSIVGVLLVAMYLPLFGMGDALG